MMKYCVLKAFITSQLVGQLGICRINYRNFIRLQNQAKDDISRFAHSLLNNPKFTHLLGRARKYIVKNAQRVFLRVILIGEELRTLQAESYPP